jgi:hypothetical protein
MRPGGSIHPRATSFRFVIDWIYGSDMLSENHEKSKHQKPNLKQMPMTEIQN